MGTQPQPAPRSNRFPSWPGSRSSPGTRKCSGTNYHFSTIRRSSPSVGYRERNLRHHRYVERDRVRRLMRRAPCFHRLQHQMLSMEYFALLPAGVVFEIQESVPADDAVIALCDGLKQADYMIALDNFLPGDAREPLVRYADFLKVDIKKISQEECAAMVARYNNRQCRMLAQRVNTQQEFATAKKIGFTQFQGYFFRHTEHLRARHIPCESSHLTCACCRQSQSLRLILQRSKISSSASPLCATVLLRYLNSPLLGLSTPVLSIRHAFNMMGERELVRWIRMASTLAMGQEKCSDLVLSSLVRLVSASSSLRN